MKIKSLNTVPAESVLSAYQSAFGDETEPALTFLRWEMAGVDLHQSVGAFDEDKLVAFILNSKTGDTLFHFSIGVIPEYRGHHLLEQLFRAIPPSYDHYQLQVLKDNVRALSIYQKEGFEISRELISLEGILEIPQPKNDIHYVVKNYEPHPRHDHIRLTRPSFESSMEILKSSQRWHETHEIYSGEKLMAYAHFTPISLTIREVGAIEPVERHLDQLFYRMKLHHEFIRVLDLDSKVFISYLETRGLKKMAREYEMIRGPLSFSLSCQDSL